VSLAGNRATALALVFSELLQNALEHGGQKIKIELVKKADEAVLTITDDGAGIPTDADGTGLSIVQALIKDELKGRLELKSEKGTRAEVSFPA
jgi:two-component sensor histidine kinase